MTEEQAFNNPELKVILLLSGYAREIREGKDFEEITYNVAANIVNLFSNNESISFDVIAWLGQYRDYLPIEAINKLQDICKT